MPPNLPSRDPHLHTPPCQTVCALLAAVCARFAPLFLSPSCLELRQRPRPFVDDFVRTDFSRDFFATVHKRPKEECKEIVGAHALGTRRCVSAQPRRTRSPENHLAWHAWQLSALHCAPCVCLCARHRAEKGTPGTSARCMCACLGRRRG